MKEVIEKISSYNLFNYLLPGTVFVFVLAKISKHDFTDKNIFISAFLYYFIGLIISRIGSVLVEPLLKKVNFIKFADYSDFVIYSKQDDKINILSESNNIYRTIVALILSLLFVKVFDWFVDIIGANGNLQFLIIMVLMLTLFLFSYRKQTNFITKRINTHKGSKSV